MIIQDPRQRPRRTLFELERLRLGRPTAAAGRGNEHPLLRDTTFSSHLYPPMSQINFRSRMSIRIYAHCAAKLQGRLMPAPIEVEAPGVGIDLDGDTVLGA
jgi:hypothetical protein